MEKNIFKKIKSFLKNIFKTKKQLNEGSTAINENVDYKESENITQNKNIFEKAAERNYYIDLQKKYMQGIIKEEDMSEEEIDALEKLFEEQIENIQRENIKLKRNISKSLVENNEFIELFKKYKNGEIKQSELTKEQKIQIDFLYEIKRDNLYTK